MASLTRVCIETLKDSLVISCTPHGTAPSETIISRLSANYCRPVVYDAGCMLKAYIENILSSYRSTAGMWALFTCVSKRLEVSTPIDDLLKTNLNLSRTEPSSNQFLTSAV